MPTNLRWPLMKSNFAREDLDAVVALLQQEDPILTQSTNVRAFEEEWSEWLGVRFSVFVNSGSSANLLTLAVLKELYDGGEVLVPAHTWVSDIASVMQNGFRPVFVDVDPHTLGMDVEQTLDKITPETRAVFLTHVLGFNALNDNLLDELELRGIPLIEDVCESYGATHHGRKLGSFGMISNFSFYYAHHMTTIEGGMVSTNDERIYQMLRMLRSHGMVRESTSDELKESYLSKYPDLNPDFIFAFPAYNVRSTELNAVIGRKQLRRLDENNRRRRENLRVFLENLDGSKYRTDYATEGSCNYALTLVLRRPDRTLWENVTRTLREHGVEYRRGMAGGGNQLRQPYVRRVFGVDAATEFPHADHIHFYGLYIGNYPELEHEKIRTLCEVLNALDGDAR
jgi:CDP-6-deoxy-D-xylo-4-hexulose-3-dehydrase